MSTPPTTTSTTTASQRLKTAQALYWSARRLKTAMLRHLHPDWDEEHVQQTVRREFMLSSLLN